jgi:hypothetical protein
VDLDIEAGERIALPGTNEPGRTILIHGVLDLHRQVGGRIRVGLGRVGNGGRVGEAGVPRNALTLRHLDLKNEFYAKVKERGQPKEAEIRLRKQVVRLEELREKDKAELEQFGADVEGLVRAVNPLTLENRQLRGLLSAPDPAVRVLPVQYIPPQSS